MAGKDGDNGCWKRKGCLIVASHIYIWLKPLINLHIMDCLRFLPRNALGLVLSSESICKSSWAVWELTVAELHAQLRPGFKGHSFWSTSFSSRVSVMMWCLWLPSTANGFYPSILDLVYWSTRLVPAALPFLSAQRGSGLLRKRKFSLVLGLSDGTSEKPSLCERLLATNLLLAAICENLNLCISHKKNLLIFITQKLIL